MSAYLLGIGFRADMGTCVRKLVWLKLIDACEEDGSRIFPAIATIARAAQCSTRQAQREMKAFVDIGLLRLVKKGGNGPRSTNEYALDLDMVQRLGRDGWDVVAAEVGLKKGDTVSPLEAGEKGDTDDAERVTPETSKGDKLCHPTPPDPSIDPSSEREARGDADGQGSEISDEGASEPIGAADTPGTAAFEKRVMRFCNGRGFLAGPWKDWDTSSPNWIGRQFASLSAGERADAERWRDPYLFDLEGRGKPPVTVGVFLRDKLWTGLDPMLLQRAERRKAERLKPEERAQPDGWAACLGPVGMAWLFAKLLAGAADPAAMARPLLTDAQLRDAWSAVWWFQAMQRQKGGAVFDPQWHALKPAMEFVPKSTVVLAAWRDHFAEHDWKWLNAFDTADGVYCPKGGPAGLAAFEEMVRGGTQHSQAAE